MASKENPKPVKNSDILEVNTKICEGGANVINPAFWFMIFLMGDGALAHIIDPFKKRWLSLSLSVNG